jgi:hypothetical protein
MNEHDNAIVLALVEILAEHVEEIAQVIEKWGPASDELDAILRECLKAAEVDAA